MGYSFPEGSILPYESLWSMVHKFAYWNVCDVKDIQAAFHLNRKLKGGWYISTLLKKPQWDVKRMAAALKIESLDIHNGFVETYLANNEISTLFYGLSLRYCPECVAIGYHSIIHQLNLFESCPFHGLKLEDKCNNCRAFIVPGLNSKAITNIYSCQLCSFPLYDFSKINKSNIASLTKCFTEIGDLIKFRKKKCLVSSPLLENNIIDPVKMNRLWSFWKNVYGDNKNDDIELTPFKQTNNNHIKDQDLNEIYLKKLKSIKKTFVGEHIKCVQELHSKYFGLGHLSEDSFEGICEIAYAYLCWRMYWESTAFNGDLSQIWILTKDQNLIRVKPKRSYNWLYNEKIAKEIFEIDCLSTWQSSMIYAQAISTQSINFLFRKNFDSLYLSFWEILEGCYEDSMILAKTKIPEQALKCLTFDKEHLERVIHTLSTLERISSDEIKKIHPRNRTHQ